MATSLTADRKAIHRLICLPQLRAQVQETYLAVADQQMIVEQLPERPHLAETPFATLLTLPARLWRAAFQQVLHRLYRLPPMVGCLHKPLIRIETFRLLSRRKERDKKARNRYRWQVLAAVGSAGMYTRVSHDEQAL